MSDLHEELIKRTYPQLKIIKKDEYIEIYTDYGIIRTYKDRKWVEVKKMIDLTLKNNNKTCYICYEHNDKYFTCDECRYSMCENCHYDVGLRNKFDMVQIKCPNCRTDNILIYINKELTKFYLRPNPKALHIAFRKKSIVRQYFTEMALN